MRHATAKLFLFATTALTVAVPAMAQSGGDIVVTARRTEERLQDVPISITVFNDQQIANNNIVSAADLATITPSLTANTRYGAEAATFAIRGFTQDNYTSPSVAVYFADVIGPRAQGGTPGGNGAGVGQFFDLQNVQVLKGPQGTLFGRNTTGGAVLIVPQRPTDKLEGYVEGSYGNYDMYRVQAVINAPLSDTFKVRLGVDRQKRDGYLHNQNAVGPRDYADTDYWAFRLGILAELTPELENYTLARYSHSRSNGTALKLVAANAPGCRDGIANPPWGAPTGLAVFLAPLACQNLQAANARGDGFFDVNSNATNPYLKIDQWAVSNTTTWNVSDTLTIKNIASYQEFQQRQSFNINSDAYTVPAISQLGTPSRYAGLPFTWVGLNPDPTLPNVAQWTASEELQLQGRTNDGALTYVVGGYYEKSGPNSPFQGSLSPITYTAGGTFSTLSCTDVSTFQCTPVNGFGLAPGVIPGLIQNSLTRYRYRNAAFFGQATYNFTEQLAVTGGLRYTMDKVTGEGGTRQIFFFAPNTPTFTCAAYPGRPAPSGDSCLTSITQKSNKPTWLIDVDYKPNSDLLFYAKYARGYRQGNINASNTQPNAWGPEKVDAYEIGAKASFRGTLNGYFNVAAFYNNFSGQQLAAGLFPDPTIANNTNSAAQIIVNGGKSKIQGLEVDAAVNYSVFGLSVGYTYLDTKLKDFVAPVFTGYLTPIPNAVVGGELSQSPKHRIAVTPSLKIPVDESYGAISLSASYIFTDKLLAASSSPLGVLPSNEIVNATLNWNGIAGTGIDASAFITNAFNEKYPVYVANSWTGTGTESYTVGMPRMYGVRLRVKFGD